MRRSVKSLRSFLKTGEVERNPKAMQCIAVVLGVCAKDNAGLSISNATSEGRPLQRAVVVSQCGIGNDFLGL